jgi:hypothetical protein
MYGTLKKRSILNRKAEPPRPGSEGAEFGRPLC